MTKQKRIILQILKNTDSHPTADYIYQEARKVLPDISLGTVYRNLRVLREQGEILELSYGSTFSRYDGNPSNHYHFVCTKCGKVQDVDIVLKTKLEEEVREKMGVDVEGHRLEFYGVCNDCKVKN
jgi:Fur family ferric uptake transcriptional regulator/Fur family peroxide stress response transcriptional regulator